MDLRVESGATGPDVRTHGGTVCSVSATAERAFLAARLRAEGRTRVEIAEVLRQRFELGALAALRHAHGWSQDQAAKEWSKRWPDRLKTYKDFSDWETGRHTPSLDVFDKLARLYSCDLADLLADRPGYRHDDEMAQPLVGRRTRDRTSPDSGMIEIGPLVNDPFSAAASEGNESVAGQLVRMHLAHTLRNCGDYTSAAEIYRTLVGGEFDDVARYWLCDHDFLNGRFAAALAQLQAWQSRDAADEGERLRLMGHIWRVNASFGKAADTYNEAIELARGEGLAAAEAKALTNLAQTACWSGDAAIVIEAARQSRELLDLVPNPVELVKVRSAEAITAAIVGDPADGTVAIEDTRRIADDIGYRGGHNLADVASVLLDALFGHEEPARRTLGDLDQRTNTSGGNTYWVPIAASWVDGVDSAMARQPDLDWVDGPGDTLRRWAALVAR
jgi:hypothetical protein